MLRRLYDWVLHWAETPFGLAALILLAVAESSFFPVPPDVLLIAMVLATPSRWFFYALVCTLASVSGGLLGYAIGWLAWQAVDQFFLTHIFDQALFDKVKDLYQTHAFWAVFTSGLTPIPYKVFTITAGVCKVNVPIFLAASFLGRAGRFFVVAGVVGLIGKPARVFVEKYFNILSVVFVLLLIGGFVLLKSVAH